MIKTKSFGVSAGVGISYFASLRARLLRSSTERYSVVEKETREVVRRGLHTVVIAFDENRILKKGLRGERRVNVCLAKVEGLTCIEGTFLASFKYTAVHPLGFTRTYEEKVTTTFTITL